MDETRLLTLAGQFFTSFRQQPLICFTFTTVVVTDSDITRHITCQPTINGGAFQSIRTVFGQILTPTSVTSRYRFARQAERLEAGGWSLKVISDAVSMSQAGQPLANTVIRFLDSERSNQNQSV